MNRSTLDPEFADALRSELAATVTEPTTQKARTARRITVVASAFVAAALGGSFLLPGAYADWTATPQHLDPQQAQAVAHSCLDNHAEIFERFPNDPHSTNPALWNVELVERRGHWDLVLLIASSGHIGTCLQSERGGGLGTFPDTREQPTPDSITVIATQSGALNTSLWESGPRAEGHHVVYGRVGTEVQAIVVRTEQQGDVTASLDDGYWVAWWPISNFGFNLSYDDDPILGATFTMSDGTVTTLTQEQWSELASS